MTLDYESFLSDEEHAIVSSSFIYTVLVPDLLHPAKYFDRKGNPITEIAWSILYQKPKYRVVKKETIGKWLIKTIWLGMDHNYSIEEGEKPIVFETQVSWTNEEALDYPGKTFRYHTEREALNGHNKIKNAILEKDTDVLR